MSSIKADKLSYSLIDQTCPTLDCLEMTALNIIEEKKILDDDQMKIVSDVVGNLIRHIKDQATEKLREQLTYACDNWLEYESDYNDMKSKCESLEYDNEQLRGENDSLHNEINTLNETIQDLENS